MSELDWGLLTQPNFAASALSGYQAGQKIGQQRQLDAAMQNIDLDKPETLLPYLRKNPTGGAALMGAALKMHAEAREQSAQQAQAAWLKARLHSGGAGTGSALGGAPVEPSGSPAALGGSPSSTITPPASVAGGAADPALPAGAPTVPDTSGDIVVSARPSAPAQPDVGALQDAAIDADPSGFLDLQPKIASMGDADRKALADRSEAFAVVGQQALKLPYQQRRAFLQAQSGYLAQHGVPAGDISGFDPTDDALHTEVGKSVGVKGLVEQANKDREFGLSQDKFGEEQRHNKVDEGQGAARIGLEGANVSIARGHLALDQKTAVAKSGGGSVGGIATPTSRSDFAALASGTRFYAPDGSIRIKP